MNGACAEVKNRLQDNRDKTKKYDRKCRPNNPRPNWLTAFCIRQWCDQHEGNDAYGSANQGRNGPCGQRLPS
jgi:hypothetical protein